MEEQIKKLKEYVLKDGVYSNIRANSVLIRKHFPDIYEQLKDDYKTKLYMLLYDIKEIPICKNPGCGKQVKLENIGAGFRKYCCNACIGKHQHVDKEFAKRIKDVKNERFLEAFEERYDCKGERDGNYLIIKDHCKHGDVTIYDTVHKKMMERNAIICEKCNDELIETFVPTKLDIEEQHKKFIELKTNNFYFTEKNTRRYEPKLYKCIKSFSKKYENTIWLEEVFMFQNQINDRPICEFCNNDKVDINTYLYFNYKTHCTNTECINKSKKITIPQKAIYEFIKSHITENILLNYKFKGKELDVYIPDKNIAYEYNGFYWHKDRSHAEKWNLCKENGIKLITIWEDDYFHKYEIVKSIIQNSLGLTPNKIYARKCVIKEISPKENEIFCTFNHIQGAVPAKTKIGLFYNDELVSVMTFGKKRIIMKSKSKNDDEYELLRFCNKRMTSVIGGASKLFNYFVKNHHPKNIVSYANLDISDGKIYEILGFENKGFTGINYWWAKDGIKYHRSRFMKHKLVKDGHDPNKTEDMIMKELGYYKIFGNGNIKYEINL